MKRIPATLAELFELLVLLAGSAAVSALGVMLELTGLEAVAGGELAVGAWALVMGAAALYAGVVALGYEQVLPRVRALATDA